MQNKILLIVITTFFISFISSAAQTTNKKPLKVGYINNLPPHYQVDNNKRPSGFAIQCIEEIAKLANYQIKYVQVKNWKNVRPMIINGDIDIMPNWGITKERLEYFDYSDPIETFPISLFVAEYNKDIFGLESLANKKVGIIRVNIGNKIIKKQPKAIIIKFPYIADAIFSLIAGNIEALIFPDSAVYKITDAANLSHKIKKTEPSLLYVKRAIVIKKGNKKILSDLNMALNKFLLTEDFISIYNKWYKGYKPFWTVKNIIVLMSIVIIILLLAMAIWRYFSLYYLNLELKKNINMKDFAEHNLKGVNDNLEKLVQERTKDLTEALNEIKKLCGLLPICSYCKKVRDDKGYWSQIELYIEKHSEAEFTHSICEECKIKYFPEKK